MLSSILSAAISGVNCWYNAVTQADVEQWASSVFHVGYICPQESKRLRTGSVQHLETAAFLCLPNVSASRSSIFPLADIRKEGTGFDLPIAAALLCSFGFSG